MSPERTRQISTAVKVLGLLLLVVLVAQRLDPRSVAGAFHGTASQIGAAVVLFMAAMVFRVAKWLVQARATGFEFRLVSLIHGFLWGILLGVVTPMRLGEMYRFGALRKHGAPLAGADLGLAAAALVLEKSYEVLTLTMLVAAGATVALPVWWVGAGLWGCVAMGAALGLGNVPVPNLPGRLGTVLGTLKSARDVLSVPQRLYIVGCTLVANLLNLVGAAFVYRMFGDIEWAKLLFGLPVVAFSSAIPITISGFGLREMASMQVFGSSGYPESAAAVAATLVFLGTNILPALAAFLLEPFVSKREVPSKRQD
jgi:hypothetical protein